MCHSPPPRAAALSLYAASCYTFLRRPRAATIVTRHGMRCSTAVRALPLLLLLLCASGKLAAAVWELTILHTNDVHARVEETNKDSGKCTKGDCYAGVARRFTKIQEIRRSEKNPVLLLDAGDQFQGTVWFNYYKGTEAAHFMNRLGYDAMVSTDTLSTQSVHSPQATSACRQHLHGAHWASFYYQQSLVNRVCRETSTLTG